MSRFAVEDARTVRPYKGVGVALPEFAVSAGGDPTSANDEMPYAIKYQRPINQTHDVGLPSTATATLTSGNDRQCRPMRRDVADGVARF